MTKMNAHIQNAVDAELAKMARAQANIERAFDEGRISEHDRDERVAREEQWATNRIAFLKGEPRPRQREQQPLNDPDAGKVG